MVPGGSGNCVLTLEGKKKEKDLMSKLRRIIDMKERRKHNRVVNSMCMLCSCRCLGEKKKK